MIGPARNPQDSPSRNSRFGVTIKCVEAATLRTGRLVLLPLGPADLDETAALYSDDEVMRHVAGGTRDRASTAESLKAAADCWRNKGWGPWAIRDATTGAFLGEGGLQPTSHHGETEGTIEADFGYTLCRRSWGKGYAAEAGEVMLADAWRRYDGSVIHAVVTPDNTESQKVLRKLGFSRTGTITLAGETHQLWAADRTPEAGCGS